MNQFTRGPRFRGRSARFHRAAVLRHLLLLTLMLPAVVLAQPQVPLDPALIPKFATPLPLPGALDGTATSAASPLIIRMSEFQQQILPAPFYAALPAPYNNGTYVWGYNGSYPGPTIVARRGTPTHVKYVNDLHDPLGGPLFLQRTIAVDQTLHWAEPLDDHPQTTPYLGPVPAVVHLHGGEVPSAFDGGPDAWWTPDGIRGPGYVTDQYVYPNEQQAMTMFYHDHALGVTRLNVYAGLAGFYLLLDPAGEPANLPGGAADHAADQYGNPYQVGLAIQDRMFDTQGQLYFPSVGINPEHPYWLPEFFGNVILVNGKPWPYMQVEPRRYRFRFLNGSNARAYEMRLMDKTLKVPGPAFLQIGSDGGLLDTPVKLNDPLLAKAPRLLMASGERADVVIDFSGHAGKWLTLVNSAKSPYPKGVAADPRTSGVIMQFRVGTSVTGGADPSLDPATTTPLRPTPIERPAVSPVKRALTLNEEMGPGGPLAMFVNNTMWDMMPTENVQVGDTEVWEIINLTADTHPIHLHLFQFQLLNRQAFNSSKYLSVYGMPMPGMGPPLPYDDATTATGFKLGGNPDVTPYLQGPVVPPDPNERGWKDTFRMNPGEVTRIIIRAAPQDAAARAAASLPPATVGPGVNLFGFEPWTPMGQEDSFGYPGGPGYVWHCHIIDHEDNEMMRQLMVLGPTLPVTPLAHRAAMATAPDIAAAAATPRSEVELASSLPNPVAGSARIRFSLPAAARVDLSVFDLSGRTVTTLATGSFAAGEHAVVWDARDRSGNPVANGTYFYRLQTDEASKVRKLVVVR
jgi:spore coat protein A, manganese oxidase